MMKQDDHLPEVENTTVNTKYFYVSCMYNATSSLGYFKPNLISQSHIMVRRDGSYPKKNEIIQSFMKELEKEQPNIAVYEPFTILSCTEWSKEQYDVFVS